MTDCHIELIQSWHHDCRKWQPIPVHNSQRIEGFRNVSNWLRYEFDDRQRNATGFDESPI